MQAPPQKGFCSQSLGSELRRLLPYILPVIGVSCVEVALGTVVGQSSLCHKVRVFITASVPVCLSSCLLPACGRALSWWWKQGWGRR